MNPVNATIAGATGTAMILDDDALDLLNASGSVSSAPGGGVTIGWDAVIGRQYTILFSTDLVTWAPLAGAELITATSTAESFEHTVPPSVRGFYRIVEGFTP